MVKPCTDQVSLVVLTYNRSTELCRSLQRLTALPDQPRIIVVDNGSTDDTVDCVQRRFPQVELIEAGVNLGAAGRNLGVEHVRTPYVAFSDDDTWWAPGALCTAAGILDENSEVTVLVARIMVGVEERADPTSMAMSQSPLGHIAGIGPLLVGFMAGACVMRSEAFREAGGYWRHFFIGGEETLLAMDIIDAGGRIVYAPKLRVHHWPSSLRDDPLRRKLLARNAIWTAWLRLPARLAWQRSVQALHAFPALALRGRIVADALAGASTILRNRRVLSKETCEMFERVWRHEALAATAAKTR